MAVGLGVYGALGQPQLALKTLAEPAKNDYSALISMLARRMPDRPGDIEGWTLLGRGYLSLGNAAQAEKALARAVEAEKTQQGAASPQLLSSYGEAMTEAAGQVSGKFAATKASASLHRQKRIASPIVIKMAMAGVCWSSRA